MNTPVLTAFVPIKNSSERLNNKNFLDFAGRPLYQVILAKLQNIDLIDQIVIDTDSDRIATESVQLFSKVKILPRPAHILGHHITMNTILEYDLSQVPGEHFLQTHATNPLLSERTIVESVKTYFDNLKEFDSLLTVNKILKRAYDHQGRPINCSREVLEQTQHLPEILIENSNLFIFSRTSFHAAPNNRIGRKPKYFYMSEIEGIDIDYQHEFTLAQLIHQNKELFPVLNT